MEGPEEEEFGAAIAVGSETTAAEKEFEKVLEELREAEGLKLYSDVYTKLFDSYHQLKAENVQHQDTIATIRGKVSRYDAVISDYLNEIADGHTTIDKLRAEIRGPGASGRHARA
ncbi:unnamed protein product [Leptidea sinapis]|uniref:Uncharacterized protein n=1 Tax=Leptidea sinapis TaxID=189913 RepID=A0A5E4R714_9NEOP|nr:unnamed protein product [Leptidea sinapis]